MPELPEVETIRRGLEKYLTGKTIKEIKILDEKLIEGDPKKTLNAKILAVKRYGKGLVIELNNDYSIAFHIKLTGQLIYRGKENKNIKPSKEKVGVLPSKFTRAMIYFKPQGVLYFNDVRRFAWMKILKQNNLSRLDFFKHLGPEPLKDLTLENFFQIVKKSNQKIKALLMDQKKISGIGNIYANESLFRARINPLRKASSLTEEEIKRLYNAIEKVLKEGIKYSGVTEVNFVNADGEEGKFQKHLKVYGKKGKPCPSCGLPIKHIKISGRSTFYCEKCQK